MTMQGGTARDRLRARAQAMYGGKRREDEEQQNRKNQRQEAESPAVGSARDRLRQRASTMGVVTGQGEDESITMPERKPTWTDKVRSGGRTGNYTTVASTPGQQESVLRKGLSGKRPQRTDAEQVESLLRKGGTTEAVKASKKTGGKFDVGEYSKQLGRQFLSGIAEGGAATLAAGETLIGKGLDKLFPGAGFEGSGVFNALYHGRPDWKLFGENGLPGIKKEREYTQEKLAENIENIDTGSELGDKVAKKAASFGSDAAYGTGNALPMAVEAIFSGGKKALSTLGSLGANVVKKSGLAGKLEEAAKLAGNTLRSREYWTSFLSEVGMDYYEALDNGATDDEATRYALSSALVNSVIEIGGGIQKIPDAPTFRTWIKGAHEEGMEEIQQGIVSRLMENAVYDKKNPLVSVTDENAVVNPVTAANEYAGGFAVGGLLGGVQQGMAKRAQTRQEAELVQYQENLDKLGEEFTPAAKEMAQERLSLDSEDYTAQRVMNALDSGEAVSGEDIRTLILDNVKARNTAALAEIKEKIAQRLTDLGETKDANAVADAMVRYFTVATRGNDKASRAQRAAEQETIFRSRYGDHVSQELMQTENVPQWVQGLPRLTTVYGYEQAHRPVAERQTGAEAPAEQEAETAVEQGTDFTEQSAEPEKVTSDIVRKAAESRETLEQLGIDPQGKTGSQLRAEVRKALTERQDVAQEVQQRTQVAQQTQETKETAKQTQGEPVTLEEASKAYGKQAKAFLRTYQQGQDVEKFSEAYRIAHEMGQSNVPYRVVQGLRSLDYLTEAQKDIAYRTGASAEQQERGGKKATRRRQGVVRAENGANLSDLSKTFNVPQKQGYRILSDIAKATGVDIVLYRSKGDARGNITEEEGRFRRSENTIYIDVNSGIDNVNSVADFSQYTMLRTFNHEFTHFIEQNAAEEYRELRKLVFEVMQEKLDGQGNGVTVDDLIREKQDKYRQALGQEVSYDEASREVVADAMTDILPDSHFMETLYSRNATLAEKLIGKLKEFIAKVRAYFDGLTTNTKAEAALLKEMRDGGLHYLERIVEAYDKAATAAVENYQGADNVLQENGIDVSEDGKSASMDAFSVRTMLNEEQKKSVVKALAERFDVTEEEAGGWLKAETSLASIILNPKYSMYLDYEADPEEEAIKKNSDYPQGTVDFSTICRKRRDFTDVMNRIFRLYPNHVFQAEDLAKIRTIMQEEGMNVACGICYVEDRRQLDSIVAEDFLQALELYRNGSETRPDGKPFNQNQLRGLRYTNGDTYVPTVAELITLEGNNALKKKNPNMAEAWRRYNNARGMQSVRRLTNEAEYKRQILKYSKRTVQSKNSKGGLRIFSFSDMEMFHLLDVIQIITDASTKGLYIQGYTKVNEYAKAVKDTGMKLNRSLIPAGELGYHMEDGNPVLDFDTTEGIDIHAKDFFDNSSNPDIGNIVIGINDTQIRAAMVSEFIDQIIPFHTGQSEAVLREKKIDAWENYKDYQTDKDMETGKTAKQQVNIYTDVLQVLEREGAEITKRSFVEKYLEVCRDRGLIPRFAQFLNQDTEGNYVYTEGYHKLLVDFKTFAQTEKGEYLPQKDVRPVFDEQYLTSILKDYVKEQSRRDRAMKKQMPRVIQRISDEVVQGRDVQLAIRDSEGRILTEAQQDYFKDSKVRDAEGRLKVVYHGSGAVFTKFSADFMSQNGSAEGQGFYFTDYKPMAEGYYKKGGQLLEGYLDMKKPLSDSEVTLTYEEVRKLIKAVDPTGDDLVLNYDSKGGMGYPSREWYNRSVEDTLRATMSTSDSDSEILAELANGMGDPGAVLKAAREVLGYDGYIVEGKYDNATVYVAFDSSQFKNVDNQSPTADPDIRYSIREIGGKVMPGQTESQAQIRSSTLSDRDVLRIAAQMAKNSESRSLTDADRARLGIIEQKLGRIDEAEEQRQGFLEEKRAILAGREAKELSDAERAKLRKVQKDLDTVNGKIRRLNEELSQTQEKKVVKELLKKARVVVERDAVQRSVSSYRETRQRAEYMGKLRRSVERNAKRLQEMLLTNTDKKHVPEALKKPVAELLRSMNLISKRGLAGGAMTKADERYVKALRGIQDVLARQSLYEENGEGDDLIGGYLDLPAGFQTLLNAYVSKVEKAIEEHPLRNGVLQTMTVEELEETNTVLSVISTAVTEMNKLMVNRQFATVVDAAEDTIWALNEHEQHQKKTGENFLVWDNCLPWYAFQRFGEGGKSIFQGLMDGWDKLSFNTQKVLDFRNGLIDDKTARKWDTETHTVMLENSKGGQEEVTLTTAQLMSLYCLSRRKQAMGHLMGGGIRIASIDIAEEIESARAAEEGKPVREKKKKKKDVDQAEHYLLTQGELGRLLSLLTPEQVQAARAMQKYMTDQGSAWGNEVSMRRFGYRAFTEENYFPIETDSQDRPAKTDSKEGSLYRLLNLSAVKPLTEGANNAIMVRSIFDVFANHMADMAKYNALALPVLDAQKWYNYKDSSKNKDNGQVRTRTVQREITRAWGSGANNYVVTFLKDINGVKENGARGEGMAAKAISKYKRAAVAANLRVAMLQPTSYVRASAVIDHKYLAKALTKKVITKAEGQEMLQYSGVALWKEMGFFDTDVGRSIRDRIKGKGSKIEDLVDKSMAAAQAGDKITWERLWLACKLEVEEKRHLTGEELMEATAERFRDVIYRTQVVDSTMTRSHMMRDGGTFSKIATSFMSESTVSYNMLMNSTLDTLQDAQSMGMQKAVKKNWRHLGLAYQAYILAGAASAIAGALADALRDWDDDSFLEKFWKAFWGEKPEKVKDQVLNIMLGLEGNLAGELNPLGKIPLIRDVTNTFGGFSTDRMDMAAWSNLYSLLGIWEETIGLWTGSLDKATKTTYYGNMTTYNKIYKTAQVVSQFTGLPISATMRELVTMWNSTVGLAYPGTKVRTYESRKVREAYEQYGKSVGLSYVMILRAAEAVRQLESDKDEDGNAISGSLKKKYVEYIQSLHLSAKQEKAMWNCIKKASWSDKDTPWGK